jgi:hypothetical protein
MLGLVLAAFAGSLLITRTPLFHPTQGVIFLGLFLSVTGLFSKHHKVHAILAVTMSILVGYSVVLASNSSF